MKALVVEDESITRELMAALLKEKFAFDSVMESSDGESAWELIQSNHFELIVLDLVIPKLDGLALAHRIHGLNNRPPILAISSECDEYTVREVNRRGIFGFINKKEVSLSLLSEAISAVSSGHSFFSPSVERIIEKMVASSDSYHLMLSDRETEVVQAIVSGQSCEVIAKRLGITEFTVRRHRQNAMKKLNVPTEAALVRFALDCGMLKNKGGLGWTHG